MKLLGTVPVSKLLASRTTLKPARSTRREARLQLRRCSKRLQHQGHGDHKIVQTLAAAHHNHHHPRWWCCCYCSSTQAQAGSRTGHTKRQGVRGLKASRSLPMLNSGSWPTSWLCERSTFIWVEDATQLCARMLHRRATLWRTQHCHAYRTGCTSCSRQALCMPRAPQAALLAANTGGGMTGLQPTPWPDSHVLCSRAALCGLHLRQRPAQRVGGDAQRDQRGHGRHVGQGAGQQVPSLCTRPGSAQAALAGPCAADRPAQLPDVRQVPGAGHRAQLQF